MATNPLGSSLMVVKGQRDFIVCYADIAGMGPQLTLGDPSCRPHVRAKGFMLAMMPHHNILTLRHVLASQ